MGFPGDRELPAKRGFAGTGRAGNDEEDTGAWGHGGLRERRKSQDFKTQDQLFLPEFVLCLGSSSLASLGFPFAVTAVRA